MEKNHIDCTEQDSKNLLNCGVCVWGVVLVLLQLEIENSYVYLLALVAFISSRRFSLVLYQFSVASETNYHKLQGLETIEIDDIVVQKPEI